MTAQEAATLIQKVRGLFPDVTTHQLSLLRTQFERFDHDLVDQVIDRYAEQSPALVIANLLNTIRERATPASPLLKRLTEAKRASDAEQARIDEKFEFVDPATFERCRQAVLAEMDEPSRRLHEKLDPRRHPVMRALIAGRLNGTDSV